MFTLIIFLLLQIKPIKKTKNYTIGVPGIRVSTT